MIGVKYGSLAGAAMMALMNMRRIGRAAGGAIYIPKRTKLKRRLKTLKGRRK